jgi:hypothetical protein
MPCESGVSNGRALVRAAAIAAAALLVLGLSAVPAFGQNGGGGGAQYSAICQNIIGEFGVVQNQEGNAAAAAQYGNATAEVAQEQGVSVAQVNECLNGAGGGPGVRVAADADDQFKEGVLAATIPDKLLPNTGGMPLLALAVIGLAAIVAGVFVLRAVMSRRA